MYCDLCLCILFFETSRVPKFLHLFYCYRLGGFLKKFNILTLHKSNKISRK